MAQKADKKEPQRSGKRVIFRMTRTDPRTGKVYRAKRGHPFPIDVD